MRATCAGCLIPLDLITLTMFVEAYKLWSSSLCSLVQPPTASSLLGSNFLLSALFSKNYNISPRVWMCVRLPIASNFWTGQIFMKLGMDSMPLKVTRSCILFLYLTPRSKALHEKSPVFFRNPRVSYYIYRISPLALYRAISIQFTPSHIILINPFSNYLSNYTYVCHLISFVQRFRLNFQSICNQGTEPNSLEDR